MQVAKDLEVPYKDKTFAARARKKIEKYEQILRDGPEKRELDALLDQLRRKLIARGKHRHKGKP